MKLFSILFVSLITTLSLNVSANDGGIYYIPVDKIEKVDLEKNQDLYAEDTEVRYEFEGKKADVLRRSLPAILSVETEATKYENHLAIVDEKTNTTIYLDCKNAERDENGTFVKLKTTKCAISVRKTPPYPGVETSVYDMLGDAEELTAPVCLKK